MRGKNVQNEAGMTDQTKYLTKEGFEKLKSELHYLKRVTVGTSRTIEN